MGGVPNRTSFELHLLADEGLWYLTKARSRRSMDDLRAPYQRVFATE
jgi:hypothetical protein